MADIGPVIDEVAKQTNFSGVVRVDVDGETVTRAFGYANRAHRVPNEVETQFAIASGSKGFTALAVMSLVEEAVLSLSTTVREVLGADLLLIASDVTVEHLLAHRSGIGDYLDEDAGTDINDYVMRRPVHELATTEAFVPLLDGHPTQFAAGERFAYNNGGFVVLALVAERASGRSFHDLVEERVFRRAGLSSTAFLRSDELPGTAAVGYLDDQGLRTNVFHLPVRGNGDGGAYSTVDDVRAFWRALFDGQIVRGETAAAMMQPRSDVPSEGKRYGLGFWLDEASSTVMLEGYDAGVSFRTAHDPGGRFTYTVVSNTSTGAWPVARRLAALVSSH